MNKITVIVIGPQGSGKFALVGIIRSALADVDIVATGDDVGYRDEICCEILHAIAPAVHIVEVQS